MIIGTTIQRFIHGQYQSEKDQVFDLIELIIREIKTFRRPRGGGDLTPATPMTPSGSITSPYFYFLQYLTPNIKDKICREFITRRKQIFRKQYKKYQEIYNEFDAKYKQYKQKVKQQDETRMISSPRNSQNMPNVRRVSVAFSLFGGDQARESNQDNEITRERSPTLNQQQGVRERSPTLNQQTGRERSPTITLQTGRERSPTLNVQQSPRVSNATSTLQNRKLNLNINIQRQSVDYGSHSPLSSSSSKQKGFSNFNSAFSNYEESFNQPANSPTSLSKPKQVHHRASIFQPLTLIKEDSTQEPKLAKRPRLNLQDKKELEDLVLQYLDQFKETTQQ